MIEEDVLSLGGRRHSAVEDGANYRPITIGICAMNTKVRLQRKQWRSKMCEYCPTFVIHKQKGRKSYKT